MLISEQQQFTHIWRSSHFFAVATSWWGGCSYDLLAVFEADDGAIISEKWLAGESHEAIPSELVERVPVTASHLKELVDRAKRLDLKDQYPRLALSHFDFQIGIRDDDGEQWSFVEGGICDDEAVTDFCFDLVPRLDSDQDF